MTEIATRANTQVGAFDSTDEQIFTYLGLNPRDPKSRAVVAVARHYDLDPLLKHVIVIPKGGVYITRDGLLHVAHTSGQLDGIVVEQEPTLSEDGSEWTARVSVYRKDMRFPFTYPGRYQARGGGNVQYAQEMALKAAESHALRRAFDVTGLPTQDEQRPAEQQQRVTAADVTGPRASEPPQQEAAPGPAHRVPEPDDVVDGEIVAPAMEYGDADADAAEQAAEHEAGA
ncbi:recombinase RecT [Actinomadura sediminis]|uniref:Recombinase RecT n=1 Tax=Actinomadura sediminis TaxID=1038904 RepID=A0ABW3EPU5_9ACTN